jgi:hypothetical protein
MGMQCPNVVSMLITIWKCVNEKGFNQRCTIYFSINYYVYKKSRKGKQEWTKTLLIIVYNKLTPSTIVVVEHVTIVAPRLCVFKCLAWFYFLSHSILWFGG